MTVTPPMLSIILAISTCIIVLLIGSTILVIFIKIQMYFKGKQAQKVRERWEEYRIFKESYPPGDNDIFTWKMREQMRFFIEKVNKND